MFVPNTATRGFLDLDYNYEAAAPRFPAPKQPGLWRYRALLPLPWTARNPPPRHGVDAAV